MSVFFVFDSHLFLMVVFHQQLGSLAEVIGILMLKYCNFLFIKIWCWAILLLTLQKREFLVILHCITECAITFNIKLVILW